MKVFFDNCLPPVFATTLDGFIRHRGHAAHHISAISGLPKGRHSTDIEWIAHLKEAQEFWIFVSGDGRMLKNRAERAALREAGLFGFILAPAFQKTPLHQAVATLVWRWPDIEAVTQLFEPPAIQEIPIQRSSKLITLPL